VKPGGFGVVPLGFATNAPRGSAGSFTFRIADDELPILDVFWPELENFTHSHPSTSHQFQHDSISRVVGPKDHFINNFLFQNLPNSGSLIPKQLPQNHGIARILKVRIKRIFDEIEEG
jgi:hypothetical protein